MVEFNKILIIPNNVGIYINCNVSSLSYFKDVYIDKIVIDTDASYNINGVSSTPIYEYTAPENTKEFNQVIPIEDLLVKDLSKNIFFIYIITKGNFSSDTPCGMDCHTNIKAAVDTSSIFKASLKFISDRCNDCIISKEFIEYILAYKYFDMSLKAKNFTQAIKYWQKFTNLTLGINTNECKCNRQSIT